MKLENNLEREKRLRADVEKNKRKLESDLRSTQDAVEELERLKRELEESVRKYVDLTSSSSSSSSPSAFVVRLLHAEHRCIPRVTYYKNRNVSVR